MKYEYIEFKGNIYAPRMASLCEARTRSEIFLQHKGKDPLIVSPREWDLLVSLSEVKHLEV
jgi:hypothetical protein